MDAFINFLEAIAPYLLASLPGILALIAQKLKIDAEKRLQESNIKKVDVETTEKTVSMVGGVQDIYQEMMTDMKTQFSECKDKLIDVLKEVTSLKEENASLSEKSDRLTLEVSSLRTENTLLHKQISILQTTVEKLVKQLKALNIEPDIEE